MNGVWPAYPQRVDDVLRKCIHRFPFLASHTQSTLVIRWSYAGHTLVIRWSYAGHTLTIRYSYATIMHFEGLFVRMKIILLIFIRNSYVYLIRYSVIPPISVYWTGLI